MKIWVDDVRPAPDGYVWCKSVNEAKDTIVSRFLHVEEISLDHDAGDFAKDGGDYLQILNWLEEISHRWPNEFAMDHIAFNIHSMNPVGVQNMRAIIQHNGWKEI